MYGNNYPVELMNVNLCHRCGEKDISMNIFSHMIHAKYGWMVRYMETPSGCEQCVCLRLELYTNVNGK